MKVFVTGGTGFIGSYIVKDLLEHGAQIAQMAVCLLGSKSEITLEDKGRPAPEGMPIDVSQIKNTFGFAFKADEYMKEHIQYLSTLEL